MSVELTEREKMLHWIETWKEVGPVMEREKYERMARPDSVRRFVAIMAGIIKPIDERDSRWKTSGLVEQQRLYQLLR